RLYPRSKATKSRRIGSLGCLGRGAFERALQVVAVVAKIGHGGVRLHIHHEVHRPAVEAQRLPLAAVDLAGPPFQPIADVCFPKFLRRGDAQARVWKTVGYDEEDGIAGEKFAARLVGAKKIAPLGQALFLRQCLGPRQMSSAARAALDGQTLAALPATAREHGLAILGPHADEEAVRTLATAIVGLKSTLH